MRELNVIREEILALTREYRRTEMEQGEKLSSGRERITFGGRVYDEEEVVAAVDSVLDFWLTAARYAGLFEQGLAEYLGLPFAYAVNSGSSANLLALAALTSPLLGERRLVRGSEVITLAMGFPTTVAPIIQMGCVPVFVDAEIPSYNIDVSKLEAALSPRTRAVFVAHTLGNCINLRALLSFCRRENLFLIEDNCDALGSEYDLGEGLRKAGTFGDIGTASFFPAHHMTMGEGGAVYCRDPLIARILLSMRDWGRDCVCPPGRDNCCGHRFDGSFGSLPPGYDHKYVYSHLGFNLKVTEMQAAIGWAQLKKLPGFVEKRRENWQTLRSGLADLEQWLILPEEEPHSRMSPFGFAVTVRDSARMSRNDLTAALESSGIQTRNLFAGNITRHPCFDHLKEGTDYRIAGGLACTDQIMKDTLWVGVYPGLRDEQIQVMIAAFHAAFSA